MAWRVGRDPYRVGILGLAGLSNRGCQRLVDNDDPARRRPAPTRGARVGAMRAQVVGDSRAGRRARTPAARERGGRRCQSRELCRFDPAHRGAAAAIRLRGQARAGHSGTARRAAAQTRRGVRREGRCGRRCRGHRSSRSACARRRTAGDVPRGDLQARARTAAVQARSLHRCCAYRRADHSGRAGRHALAAASRRVAAAPLRDRDHDRHADRLDPSTTGTPRSHCAMPPGARSWRSVSEPDAEIRPHAAGVFAA